MESKEFKSIEEMVTYFIDFRLNNGYEMNNEWAEVITSGNQLFLTSVFVDKYKCYMSGNPLNVLLNKKEIDKVAKVKDVTDEDAFDGHYCQWVSLKKKLVFEKPLIRYYRGNHKNFEWTYGIKKEELDERI